LRIKVSWFRNVILVSLISSKKRTKTCRIVVKLNSFVRFLEKTSAWRNHFDFVWPDEFFNNKYYVFNVRLNSYLYVKQVKVWVFWEGHKIWKKSSSLTRAYLSKSRRIFFKTNVDKSYYTNSNFFFYLSWSQSNTSTF
jgi:hypothetical protein